MTDLGDLSTQVLAGLRSVQARIKAVPPKQRPREHGAALNDWQIHGWGGVPPEAPEDEGDELPAMESLLRLFIDIKGVRLDAPGIPKG